MCLGTVLQEEQRSLPVMPSAGGRGVPPSFLVPLCLPAPPSFPLLSILLPASCGDGPMLTILGTSIRLSALLRTYRTGRTPASTRLPLQLGSCCGQTGLR